MQRDAAIAAPGERPGPVTSLQQAILDWMKEQGEPVLFSQVRAEFGVEVDNSAFRGLARDCKIEPCFPEAVPGASGRQFWKLVG
jgi:hypothetical protein